MNISELIGLRPALENLAKKEMDIKTAMIIAKLTRKILEAIQAFEVVRADLFVKFGERQEDGNIQILPENEEKFQAEIKKGLNKRVKITPITASTLKMNVAPADLVNCLKLFK